MALMGRQENGLEERSEPMGVIIELWVAPIKWPKIKRVSLRLFHPCRPIGGVISTHLYWFLGPLCRDHLNFKG